MRRTYLDAGVLIAALRTREAQGKRAIALLKETDRIFLASPFLQFELLPQAIRNRSRAELTFYNKYFANAEWIRDLYSIVKLAFKEASRSPVNGMDALHIAAASLLRADELITTETPRRSIHRNSLVRVLSL